MSSVIDPDAPRTSMVINAKRTYSPSNPHTHLVLIGDPGGAGGTRLMFGCLRPSFRGFSNSAAAFALTKIMVDTAPDTPPWTQTAARTEVLLPPGACDRFLDPKTLMETADADRPAKINALLSYFTFSFDCDRLHEAYELVRTFMRECIVDPFGVAALLVQHAPHRAGSRNQPHVHAKIPGPRRLTSLGFGEPITEFMNDKAHPMIRDAFLQFQADWPRRR